MFSVIKEKRKNNVYLVGPCIVQQNEIPLEDTLVAHLQKFLDQKVNSTYKVDGMVISQSWAYMLEHVLYSMTIRQDDIFIFLSVGLKKEIKCFS